MNRDDHSPPGDSGPNKCKVCGAALSPDSRYCPACGAAAGDLCPSCNETVEPGERFCRYCGTQVAALSSGQGGSQHQEQGSAEQQEGAAGTVEQPVHSDNTYLEPDLRDAGRGGLPGYRPPEAGGFTCPRCGAGAGMEDAYCNSCGLAFDEQPETYESDSPEQIAHQYGGVLERFVARLIDGFVLLAVWIAIIAIGGTEWIFDENDEFTLMFNVVSFLVALAYHTVFIAAWSTTPGKRVMGLRVTTTGGRTPWVGQAAVRELATIVSALPLLLGYIMAIFRQDRRTLHDLVAGTVVPKQRS